MTALYTESDFNADCALQARTARQAAEACNELLTIAQASALKLAMDALPEAATLIAETAFEAYGWPADEVDENWLTTAGSKTWAVFKAYRGGAA